MPQTRTESNELLKEQMELMKTQREIENLLEKIRCELNQLVVEEFQLKSNEIAKATVTTTAPAEGVTTTATPSSIELSARLDSNEINEQELNLTSNKTDPYSMEEEEDFL